MTCISREAREQERLKFLIIDRYYKLHSVEENVRQLGLSHNAGTMQPAELSAELAAW